MARGEGGPGRRPAAAHGLEHGGGTPSAGPAAADPARAGPGRGPRGGRARVDDVRMGGRARGDGPYTDRGGHAAARGARRAGAAAGGAVRPAVARAPAMTLA